MSTRLKNGMTTDSTGQPVPWWLDIHLRKESQRAKEFGIFIVNKSVTADGSLLSPTGGVKGMYPAPHNSRTFYDTNSLTHNLNKLEHIANNCMNITMMHTDANIAQF